MMDGLGKDVRFALRGFRKNPGFTAVALVTLALGIGANTAIFSVVNAVLIRALPYERPESLVVLWGTMQRTMASSGEVRVERRGASYPDFVDWRAQTRTFEDMAAYSGMASTLAGDEPERIAGEAVSASYFGLLGARPVIGRAFRADEDRFDGTRVVLIGHALWQRRFGGDPAIVGRSISLGGQPFTVVGVLPAGFRGLSDRAEIWLPSTIDAGETAKERGNRWLTVLARLKAGTTMEQAQADLARVCRGLEQAYPRTNDKRSADVVPLVSELFGEIRPALLAVLGAVGLVLLIACANVASLLLGRAEARQREMALRTALGASRGRLRRQLMVEGLVLTSAAGGFGLLLARWMADAIVRFSPVTFPGFVRADLDPTVLAFTLAVSVAAGALLGLAPLWQIDLTRLAVTLKEDAGRGGTAGKGRLLFRQAIVAGEIALALMLLVGAGLLIRSFAAMAAIDPGYRTDRLLTFTVNLPEATAESGMELPGILARIASVPGVERVSAGSDIPLAGDSSANYYAAEGQPPMTAETLPRAYRHYVTPGFFATLGLERLAGRDFTDADLRPAAPVVIISENIARRFWPGADAPRNALGKRIKTGRIDSKSPWLTVIGVVRETLYRELPRDQSPDPDFFFPLSPRSRTFGLFVRTAFDPARSRAPSAASCAPPRRPPWWPTSRRWKCGCGSRWPCRGS